MNNNLQDFKKLLKNKKDQKIFIITGKKSFKASGASKLIGPLLENFDAKFFF